MIDAYLEAVNRGDRASACIQARSVAETYRRTDDADYYVIWLAFERDTCGKDSLAVHTETPIKGPG